MKRPALLLVFAVILSLSFVQSAHALYKWVDDQGMLHITDYPPPTKEATPAQEPEKAPQPAAAPEQSAPPVAPVAPKAAGPMMVPAMSAPPVAAPATMQTKTVPAASTRPSTTAKGIAATKPSPTAIAVPAPMPAPTSMLPTERPMRSKTPLPAAAMAMFAGGFMLVAILIGVAVYVYFSLCMYLIAKKLNVDVAWMSWVPILQAWPFISSAGKPCWWVLLFFIPLVNFVVYVYLWMCICENLGRSKWLGLLILVPIVNMVLPGVLAFSKKEE
jgi:hypothetical protein